MKWERLPDSLTSLGEDAAFLRLLKQHCALPDDPTYTTRDALLSMYLDHAERFIDEMSGSVFRPRNYRIHLANEALCNWNVIRLPLGPVAELTSFGWTDNDADTGSLTLNDDFSLVGREVHLLPENALLDITTNLVPYPLTLTLSTSGDESNPIQKVCICQLACHCYKNPEAMGESIPDLGQAFYSTLSSLTPSFL